MTPRVADNPYKPGTTEHRAWEHEHIHNQRGWGTPEYEAATAIADARLAILKTQVLANRHPKADEHDAILREVADATRPEPPTWLPTGIFGPRTFTFPISKELLDDFRVTCDQMQRALDKLNAALSPSVDSFGLIRDRINGLDVGTAPIRMIGGRPAGRIKTCHHGAPRGSCRDCSRHTR